MVFKHGNGNSLSYRWFPYWRCPISMTEGMSQKYPLSFHGQCWCRVSSCQDRTKNTRGFLRLNYPHSAAVLRLNLTWSNDLWDREGWYIRACRVVTEPSHNGCLNGLNVVERTECRPLQSSQSQHQCVTCLYVIERPCSGTFKLNTVSKHKQHCDGHFSKRVVRKLSYPNSSGCLENHVFEMSNRHKLGCTPLTNPSQDSCRKIFADFAAHAECSEAMGKPRLGALICIICILGWW